MYDIIIVGAGVVGSAIARELSRYNADILVLEKSEDICQGTSKANTALIHGGFDAKPGTLKAKLNVLGNQSMDKLSKDLNIPFRRNGAFVLCFDENDLDKLEELKQRGEKNGVEGLEILNKEEIQKLENNITDEAVYALHSPTAGIVCPFTMNFALAENANENGVEFLFNQQVKGFEKNRDYWRVITDDNEFETKVVINAAGLYSDDLHNMVSDKKYNITAKRGEYFLLDKQVGNLVDKTVFQLPTKEGKGVVVTPTIDGNLLIGPTAEDIEDKAGIETSKKGLNELHEKGGKSLKSVPFNKIITSFSGLRAHEDNDDFIIEEVEDANNFFDCVGIESPGLSSAPAIGNMMADMVSKKMKLTKKENFIEKREGLPLTNHMSKDEHIELIKKDKRFGQIVCRCEKITEGEIVAAIHAPLGARTVDGIKRRVRAGAGRCQGGFCGPKVIEILSRELDLDYEDVKKSSTDAKIIFRKTK
ncbi:MAG: NAD(P)/FAD-dependent oxidoreductase [Tissierellia bacterium]|nr:NAD(P)/FAD-dependent oxidoreductase [Tissierellia bacterium]